tara:strand:- start:127 stop:333 length:207 start_codon:yes stop_codon:yes gene_type:complete
MANMSYCRFENTARDLGDCVDALNNREVDELSSYEVTGLRDLLDSAQEIVYMEEYIKEVIENNRNNEY